MKKYVNDGKVAILVSPGFGAGWSTWNDANLSCDKRVVEFYFQHKDDKQFLKKLDDIDSKEAKNAENLFKSWGYEGVYFGGFSDIEVHWLPVGTKYRITEYDGCETIETVDSINWETA